MVELIGAEATLEKIKAREALIETDALDPFLQSVGAGLLAGGG